MFVSLSHAIESSFVECWLPVAIIIKKLMETGRFMREWHGRELTKKQKIEYPNSQKFVALYSVLKRIYSVFDKEEYRQEKSGIT